MSSCPLISPSFLFQKLRAVQYKYWTLSGEPLVMWLSGLHIPQSYLTALVQVSVCIVAPFAIPSIRSPLQIACRRNAWPLDRSTLFTYVTKFADPDDVEERPVTVSWGGYPGHSKCKTMTHPGSWFLAQGLALIS